MIGQHNEDALRPALLKLAQIPITIELPIDGAFQLFIQMDNIAKFYFGSMAKNESLKKKKTFNS